MGIERAVSMSGLNTRNLMLLEDKLHCETKGRDDWNYRYGPDFGLNEKGERDTLACYPDLSTASSDTPSRLSPY